MKVNLTTVLLFAVVAFCGWQFYQLYVVKRTTEPVNPNANPNGGRTSTEPQDIFGSILGAATSIFNTVYTAAKTTPKDK